MSLSNKSTAKGFPSLQEIVTNDNLREVLELAPYLTLSELLIVGSKPLSRERPPNEIAEFGSIVQDRIKKLMRFRENIFLDILYGIHPDTGLYRREGGQLSFLEIRNYMEKYQFLIRPNIVPQELESKFGRDLSKEIATYRQSLLQYCRTGAKSVANRSHLDHLQESPLDLVVFYHESYSGREPHLIFVKRKVDARIAQKIVSGMINKHLDRTKSRMDRDNFKKDIQLEDGTINDLLGLQFITSREDGISRNKEYITQSKNIEVLDVENWYTKTYGPYCAIHMDVTWNPSKGVSFLTKKHADSIEIILIDVPHFFDANFGIQGYWRRTVAQSQGHVQKYYGRTGWLDLKVYTKSELEWIKDREIRIQKILRYGQPQNYRYH